MKFKNFNIGIASSTNKDPYKAAKEAATKALNDCGKKNVFAIVHTNSEFDQGKILKGINEVLREEWVGCSVDKQILSAQKYSPDTVVSVVCISSDYMHFGVGVVDKYRKNAKKLGSRAVLDAMKDVETDKYVDSYVQFTRAKSKDYSSIVRTPPYFIFAIIGGLFKKNSKYFPGEENSFISGILEVTGPHIPMFGIGAGSDFEKFMDDKNPTTTNYQFAHGKMYTEAAVVVFVVSNLLFEIDVQHGYNVTDNYVVLTKLDKSGFNILELNGQSPVEEYCKLIGVKVEDYLKDPFSYGLKNPLGLVALDGATYIKEIYPNPDNKTLHCTYLLKPKMVMNVLKYDQKKLMTTMPSIIKHSKSRNKGKKIALSLFCNCCSRRILLEGKEGAANQRLIKEHKDLPFFGCYAFTEIGSTLSNVAQVHGETVTALILYDSLLTD